MKELPGLQRGQIGLELVGMCFFVVCNFNFSQWQILTWCQGSLVHYHEILHREVQQLSFS